MTYKDVNNHSIVLNEPEEVQSILGRRRYRFPVSTRIAVHEKQKNICASCGAHVKKTKRKHLEVHHIIPIHIAYNFFPKLLETPFIHAFLSEHNAVGLCGKCHRDIHNRIDTDIRAAAQELQPLAQALLGLFLNG